MNLLRALAAIGVALPAAAQYSGPAILSRGEAPSAIRGVPISFRPYVTMLGIYDTGLTGVAVTDNLGSFGEAKAAGVEIGAGVSGSHAWKHTLIGLDYGGSYRHYTQKTYFDGTDQSLNLGLTHQISRHTSFGLRESAGLFARDFGLIGLQSSVPFDPGSSYIPNSDFFDNRTLYMSTQADLTYLRTARLSFNAGGDYFTAKRRSKALYGITGETARGDMQYRVARYSTIGVNYTYSQFRFGKGFGDTNIHNVVATYAVRFTRNLELSSYVGAFRTETKYVQAIEIDPVIAAIIGIRTGLAIQHRIYISPSFGARLSRSFHNAVASLSASRNVTPGNGLFLTSISNNASVQLSYNGVRRWSFSSGLNYSDSKAVSNVIGHYRNVSGGVRAARQIFPSIHGVATFDVRQYDSGDFSRYNRLIYRATVGLAFSPGNLPLRLW